MYVRILVPSSAWENIAKQISLTACAFLLKVENRNQNLAGSFPSTSSSSIISPSLISYLNNIPETKARAQAYILWANNPSLGLILTAWIFYNYILMKNCLFNTELVWAKSFFFLLLFYFSREFELTLTSVRKEGSFDDPDRGLEGFSKSDMNQLTSWENSSPSLYKLNNDYKMKNQIYT